MISVNLIYIEEQIITSYYYNVESTYQFDSVENSNGTNKLIRVQSDRCTELYIRLKCMVPVMVLGNYTEKLIKRERQTRVSRVNYHQSDHAAHYELVELVGL